MPICQCRLFSPRHFVDNNDFKTLDSKHFKPQPSMPLLFPAKVFRDTPAAFGFQISITQMSKKLFLVSKSMWKPAELLEIDTVLKDQIPVIRRYSGGGTVMVDQGTIFVSFICGKDAVPGLTLYPHPIMTWSGGFYGEVFKGVGDYRLRENDYVFGDRKFGGNAQSITKARWVHHTSFLWDFKVANMAYLKLPKRIPKYRLARNHLGFICRMKDYISRSDFIERTVKATGSQFTVQSAGLEGIEALSNTKFSPSSKLLTRQELQAALVTA